MARLHEQQLIYFCMFSLIRRQFPYNFNFNLFFLACHHTILDFKISLHWLALIVDLQ